MRPRLYYLGKPEDGFGWGVANTNLIRALGEFCEVSIDTSGRERFEAPVFAPLDASLKPVGRKRLRGPRVLGYCFTEFPLPFDAARNARQFDTLFAGSAWNVVRLAERGIAAEVLQQGIDFERFTVQPASERKGFVVFSGGKFEFRKGQDYVAAALRHFMAAHPDVTLLAAWHNQWPEAAASMGNSWLLADWRKPLADLPAERVFQIPPMRNDQTPALYAQAHVGVFPNRCEAGTNLVLCEFMACGRCVIATDRTGQADVLGTDGTDGTDAYRLRNGTWDPAGWFNCNVSDLIAALEHAYRHREELPARGMNCRRLVEKFTWRACAQKIFAAAFPGETQPGRTVTLVGRGVPVADRGAQ
jgi:glycosyltransferase involved in cell wall biosynthesis